MILYAKHTQCHLNVFLAIINDSSVLEPDSDPSSDAAACAVVEGVPGDTGARPPTARHGLARLAWIARVVSGHKLVVRAALILRLDALPVRRALEPN